MAANTPPGPGVDASGQAVIDPTKNVLDLVRAETRRQDDLREMEARHLEKVADLRAHYEERLRTKESERLDAVRTVDVNAVASAAVVQRAAADALAKTVLDTAVAQDARLRAEIDPLRKDISELRQSMDRGVGAKGQVTESQAKGGNTAVWVGVAVAAVALLLSTLISVASLIYALSR